MGWCLSACSINFLLWKTLPLGRLWKSVFVNPLILVLKVVIKDQFFVTCNDIQEKRAISVLKEDLSQWICYLLYSSLLTSIFFRWEQIIDWDMLRSSTNFRVLLRELYSTNSHKASRSDEHFGKGSPLRDVSQKKQHFEIHSWICRSGIIP